MKKKELIGDFKNPGRVWSQEAERVNVHDKRMGLTVEDEGWSTKKKVAVSGGSAATALTIIAGIITKLLEVW